MDRICISAASESIKTDLGLTNQMMGYLFGIFAIGYALFQIPSGWMADKYGPKNTLTIVGLAWSSFTALTGAAWNAVSMILIRGVFGVGEAGTFPDATKAFYRWMPANERGIVKGIFHSGARVGAAMSLFLLPFLIRLVGWRLTFVVTEFLGLVWVIIWIYWFKDNPNQNKKVNAIELKYIEDGLTSNPIFKNKISPGQILTLSNVAMVMFQYVASNITFFISFTWLLPYLISQWGTSAEIYVPIPLIFGIMAQWFSGWLVTRMFENGHSVNSRKVPAIIRFSVAVIGLGMVTLIQGLSAFSFTMFFSLAVFGVEMTIAPSWSLCMDIGGENLGIVSAAMNMLGNIGSAVSAIIFPFFIYHVSLPFLAKLAGTASSFFIFAAGMNILALFSWILIRPARKIGLLNQKQIRTRLTISSLIIFLVAIIILFYRFFNS